jgi:hypothetical protein
MKNWPISYYDGFLDFSTFLIKSCIRVSKEDFWKHSRCQGQIVFNFLLTNEWTMDSLIKLWSNNIYKSTRERTAPRAGFPHGKVQKAILFECWKVCMQTVEGSTDSTAHQPIELTGHPSTDALRKQFQFPSNPCVGGGLGRHTIRSCTTCMFTAPLQKYI